MRETDDSRRARRRRRISRRDAEVLLDAPQGDSGFEDVARLLSAAAGPALNAELSGENAARAVFSAHHSASATPSKERRVFSKAMLTKAITVKIAAAVCGVTVVGAATAAETNSLPSSWQAKAHSALGPVGVPAPKTTTKGAHDTDADKGEDKDGHDADGQGTPKPTPTGSASGKPTGDKDDQGQDVDAQGKLDAAGAALLGDDGFRLCEAAENGDRDDRGEDLNTQELQKLAKAAGIPDAEIAKIKSKLDAQRTEAQKRMQDFCTRLAQAEKDLRQGRKPHFPIPLPHPGDGWPTTWPTLPSLPGKLPTSLPSHLPSGLPSGLPSKLPTGAPTGWPSGWPIDPQNPNDPVHGSASASVSGSIGIGQH